MPVPTLTRRLAVASVYFWTRKRRTPHHDPIEGHGIRGMLEARAPWQNMYSPRLLRWELLVSDCHCRLLLSFNIQVSVPSKSQQFAVRSVGLKGRCIQPKAPKSSESIERHSSRLSARAAAKCITDIVPFRTIRISPPNHFRRLKPR